MVDFIVVRGGKGEEVRMVVTDLDSENRKSLGNDFLKRVE